MLSVVVVLKGVGVQYHWPLGAPSQHTHIRAADWQFVGDASTKDGGAFS